MVNKENKMKTIYIAGSLFTPSDRHYLEEIDKIIRAKGFNTYLPHRDAGISLRTDKGAEFFEKDLEAINNCDFIIAILNGTDVDSGTAFEMGLAHSKNIRIYGILNDTRHLNIYSLNVMILNSVIKIINNFHELELLLMEIKNE